MSLEPIRATLIEETPTYYVVEKGNNRWLLSKSEMRNATVKDGILNGRLPLWYIQTMDAGRLVV